MTKQHPWNADPLPPCSYRLTLLQRLSRGAPTLVATAPTMPALLDLAEQCQRLGYEIERLERLP